MSHPTEPRPNPSRSSASGSGGDSERETVAEILDELDRAAEGVVRVSIGDVVERLGDRGFGPFLLIPALIEVSPIGGIPGLPTLLAIIIAIVAVQMLIGRDHLWLPQFIQKRSVRAGRLEKAVERLRPLQRWLDRWFHGRLSLLVRGPFRTLAAAIVVLACLTVPFLEVFPFASTIPMAVIIAFGLAITVRDGALMAFAFAGVVGGAYALWRIVM